MPDKLTDNEATMLDDSAQDDLLTVRDWVRFGTTRFRAEKLVFGHGTLTAVDEAAYLVLHALSLPVDELDPWLEARLTRTERERIAALFEKRITSRKPAPYLTNEAWIRGMSFYVDERVIVPRSYIGELLQASSLSSVIDDPDSVTRVADICTGSGCLAILSAIAFPYANVIGVDISADALEVAQRNVTEYDLADRVQLARGDLMLGLEGRFDLIISNPPYVTAEAMAAFPPEYKAEPVLAHLGGTDGMDLVRRIIAEAPAYLSEEGVLVVEVGQGRETLEAEYPDLPFLWLDTDQSEGEVFALTAAAFLAE